ncbi:MAG: DUF2231 domain-containing protein [Kineosporiaceae bacterium]
MPETIGGLPLHPLIVHATVVIVPLAAIAVLLYAFVPRFRAWSGVLTPAVALAAMVLAPLSTSTGEGLEHMVEKSQLIETHAQLGETLLPLTAVLAAAAIALYWLHRPRAEGAPSRGKALLVPAMVLAALASAGTLVQVARIGHSGAQSAWSDVNTSGTGGDEAAPAATK